MIDHEARAEALRAEQIRRGRARALDERRPLPNILARMAHDRGEALLLNSDGKFRLVPAPLPGEPLDSWPEKAA